MKAVKRLGISLSISVLITCMGCKEDPQFTPQLVEPVDTLLVSHIDSIAGIWYSNSDLESSPFDFSMGVEFIPPNGMQFRFANGVTGLLADSAVVMDSVHVEEEFITIYDSRCEFSRVFAYQKQGDSIIMIDFQDRYWGSTFRRVGADDQIISPTGEFMYGDVVLYEPDDTLSFFFETGTRYPPWGLPVDAYGSVSRSHIGIRGWQLANSCVIDWYFLYLNNLNFSISNFTGEGCYEGTGFWGILESDVFSNIAFSSVQVEITHYSEEGGTVGGSFEFLGDYDINNRSVRVTNGQFYVSTIEKY